MNAENITTAELASLLSVVRSENGISWTDADLDARLGGIIKRGIAYVNDCAGADMDYMAEGQARSLLLDYTRYARSGKLNDFWDDYRSELTALRKESEVAAYVASLSDV